MKTLDELEKGTVKPVKQNETEATHVKMLDKSFGNIDFSMEAARIERLIRGLNPWPSAFTHIHGKMLKIWEADVLSGEAVQKYDMADLEPGHIAYVDKNKMLISTEEGYLDVKEVQLEGKKRMEISAFLRGYKVEKGEALNG